VARPGSDRLIDALVAYGTTEKIAQLLTEHLDAGANHVAIQVLTPPEKLMPALTELAARVSARRRRRSKCAHIFRLPYTHCGGSFTSASGSR
jgi:hypothetical protein